MVSYKIKGTLPNKAALTMAYLIQNYQSIIDNKEVLDKQMAKIVTNRELEKLLAEAAEKATSFTVIYSDSVFNPITKATRGVGEQFEISTDAQAKETSKKCCTLM